MSLNKQHWGDWANMPPPITLEQCSRILHTEVLVIGAGIAGMTCAYSAAESGAKVTILEKSGAYSARGFNIGVVNSRLMAEKGLHNDVDEVVREWIKRCGNRCDEKLVRLFAEKSGEAMDWLLDLVTRPEYAVRPELQGCIYRGETYYEIYGAHIFYDGPIARQGKFGGMNDILEPMYQEMQKLDVQCLFHTPMVQLIREGDTITGAFARRKDGTLLAVKASRGVVLATGGIGGNDDMCADLAPLATKCTARLHWHNGGSDGDGHRAAMWAGAELEDAPFPIIMHPQAHRHASFCFLFVKQDGERFMNEDNYLQARALGVIKTGQKYAWSIFDSNWPDKVPSTFPYGGGIYWGQDYPLGGTEFSIQKEQERLDWGLKSGFTVMADTPEELAEKMGVDVEGFVRTFRSYNEMCANGRDTEFGKRRELLIPIDKPPYYARQFGPAMLAVVGGVRVDTSMRVLGEGSRPIPGLYAIGNTAGGRYGVDYPMLLPGNSHGTALTFGYLLGRQLCGK